MNINDYLARVYPEPPCWALVADVYTSELQSDVNEYRTITSSVRSAAAAFRIALHKGSHGFMRIDAPVDYCVVLLGITPEIGVHHCGVYYDGKLLHAKTDIVRYEEMSVVRDQYKLIEFWAR